jgi:N-ethylmaleimide reductase
MTKITLLQLYIPLHNLNNRMAMAPMTRSRAGNDGNLAQSKWLYADRADAGLLIRGTVVSKKSSRFYKCPGFTVKNKVGK